MHGSTHSNLIGIMNRFNSIVSQLKTIDSLKQISSVLSWDQETYMPDGAVNARAEQIATLESLVHGIFTSDETQNLVEKVTENMEALTPQQQRVAKVFIKRSVKPTHQNVGGM